MCSEEAADLLAEKVRIMEETSALLSRKAADYEAEKQKMQLAAMKVNLPSFLFNLIYTECCLNSDNFQLFLKG